MSAKTSRRTFLKTAALTTGGVVPLLAAPPGAQEDQTGAPVQEADVCVVGSGYAGLAAAYRLAKSNRSVVVLEARSRIGGRIWSEKFSDGTPVDLGGAWISDGQPGMYNLARELGVGLYAQYDAGNTIFLSQNGTIHPFSPADLTTLVGVVGLEAALDFGAALLAVAGWSELIDPKAPWAEVELPGLSPGSTTLDADRMSTATWVDLNMRTAAGKAMFTALVANLYGQDLAAVSLLQIIFMCATTPSKQLSDLYGAGPGEAEHFRVAGGAQAIANAMTTQIEGKRGRIYTSTPVKEINQTGDGVEVVSDLVAVRAKRVILAIPVAMTNYIRFTPALPPARAQLQQRFPLASVWKFWLVYDRAFWRDQGFSGASLAPWSIAPVTIDAGLDMNHPQPGLLNMFVAGSFARMIAELSPAERKALIVAEAVKRFGAPAAKLSKTVVYPPTGEPFVEKNWSAEPFIQGGFAGYPGPGVYTGYGFGPALRAQFQRAHWAGVDTATSWYATMEGAAQSGFRAAEEALAAL